jgi:hypothetical protein
VIGEAASIPRFENRKLKPNKTAPKRPHIIPTKVLFLNICSVLKVLNVLDPAAYAPAFR